MFQNSTSAGFNKTFKKGSGSDIVWNLKYFIQSYKQEANRKIFITHIKLIRIALNYLVIKIKIIRITYSNVLFLGLKQI